MTGRQTDTDIEPHTDRRHQESFEHTKALSTKAASARKLRAHGKVDMGQSLFQEAKRQGLTARDFLVDHFSYADPSTRCGAVQSLFFF